VRVAVRLDGETHEVEFDPGAATVRIDGKEHPVRVLSIDGERAEIEVAGEKLTVDGWPPRSARPLGRLSVNGEVISGFALEFRGAAPGASPSAPAPSAAGTPTPLRAAAAEGPGTPVRPPMPGKVLEVRVTEGAKVAVGEILFVLEAMKMRNEIAAPVAGVVEGLAIQPGLSVRAKDVALRIVPA
jgi:biotin carboxyl carrier protein